MQEPKVYNLNFGGANCLLSTEIALSILMYDLSNFRKFLRLSPNWNFLILQAMDSYFKKAECDFVNQYYEHLLFKRSYTNSSIIYHGGRKGIRVDRVIECEVLKNPSHVKQCLRASFAYKYTNSKKTEEHVADYKMDIVPTG